MKLTASLAALLLGSTAMAQTAAPATPPADAPKPAWTFALKGFVSMSAAYQSGAFLLSEGQQSIASATSGSGLKDKNSLTFDVRQSRFNFSVKGPQVLFGATPSGVLELDFMQGFGAGNFGDVSLLNRLRTLYSELDWGANKLQLGQQNDLVFAMAPTSLSHIAFPLGYFTGNIGWRRPGIFGYHTLALPSDLKVEGAWEVGRSQWADTAGCVLSNGTGATAGAPPPSATACSGVGGAAAGNPGGINLGEASEGPAVEGRVTVGWSKYLTGFVGAHWNSVDLSGYAAQGGGQSLGTRHAIAVVAYNLGAKGTIPLPVPGMSLTLAATGFTGQNLQPLVSNLDTGTQNRADSPASGLGGGTFRLGTQDHPNVRSMGWWAQAGLNLTKEFSLWGFYGNQQLNEHDFVRSRGTPGAAARYENSTTNLMAMYRDGGYGISLEWIEFATKNAIAYNDTTLKVTNHRTAHSDQYMLTANYFF